MDYRNFCFYHEIKKKIFKMLLADIIVLQIAFKN